MTSKIFNEKLFGYKHTRFDWKLTFCTADNIFELVIFKFISKIEISVFPVKLLSGKLPQNLTDDYSTLFQVINDLDPSGSRPLSQSMPSSKTPNGITGPQWVKISWNMLLVIDNKSALVQVRTWHLSGNKPLPEPMFTTMPEAIWHYQATRVNIPASIFFRSSFSLISSFNLFCLNN